MQEKICYGCNQSKSVSEFFKNAARADGLQTRCKSCGYSYKTSRRANSEIHSKDTETRRKWSKSGVGTSSRKLSAHRYYQKAKKDNLCISCGVKMENRIRILCSKCSQKYTARTKKIHQQRIKVGVCFQCGSQDVINKCADTRPVCEICFFKLRASFILGDSSLWEVLKKKLIAQNYRCVYSGKLLTLCENASIDHILPIARFPELAKDLDNIQWVDIVVNQMKRDLTPDEFLDLIKIIHHHKN